MIDSKFRKTIQNQKLINNNERILLAVSGGMDSITMANLFLNSNQAIGIAHLDHKLRGEESDQDRLFVEEFANINDIPFYYKQVDITALSKNTNQSKSEIGREERYSFFNEICNEHSYTKIATAHHLDDRIETFLMRAITGSGLEGLSSIPYCNGNIIRPMLDISRSEIETYVAEHNIAYREDSSNKNTDYLRNSIRHQLIPALEVIMPSYKKTMANTIENIRDSHLLLQSLLKPIDDQKSRAAQTEISIPENVKGRLTYLHYQLKDYGFSRTQLKNILEGDHSGAIVQSTSYELLRNRDKLILRNKTGQQHHHEQYNIDGPGQINLTNGNQLNIVSTTDTMKTADPFIEFVDADKLSFPLTLRRWKEGDAFKPLGMGGKSQTLKEFFINNKLSVFDKESVWVLSSKNTVYWIVGHRLSHDLRLTDETRNTLQLEFKHIKS